MARGRGSVPIETKVALGLGAGLAAALGIYALATANTAPPAPPTPPEPNFGSQKPEILQAIGPYGFSPTPGTTV